MVTDRLSHLGHPGSDFFESGGAGLGGIRGLSQDFLSNHKDDGHLLGWGAPAWDSTVSTTCHCHASTSLQRPQSPGAGPAAWEINLGYGALGICDSGHLPATVGEDDWMGAKLGHTVEAGGRLPGLVPLSATC